MFARQTGQHIHHISHIYEAAHKIHQNQSKNPLKMIANATMRPTKDTTGYKLALRADASNISNDVA